MSWPVLAIATLFAIVAVALFLFTPRLRMPARILLALSFFIVGVGSMIALLIYVGDR